MKYGALELVFEVEPETWICDCDCGGDIAIHISSLKSGKVRDCGCGRGRQCHPSLRKKAVNAWKRVSRKDQLDWLKYNTPTKLIPMGIDEEECFWQWSQWHGLSEKTRFSIEEWYWGEKPFKKVDCKLEEYYDNWNEDSTLEMEYELHTRGE